MMSNTYLFSLSRHKTLGTVGFQRRYFRPPELIQVRGASGDELTDLFVDPL